METGPGHPARAGLDRPRRPGRPRRVTPIPQYFHDIVMALPFDSAQQTAEPNVTPQAATRWTTLLAQHPWLAFVLPMLVFMLLGSLEPTPTAAELNPTALDSWDLEFGREPTWMETLIPYSAYPWIYTLKIVLTCLAIGMVWPVYRSFPLRISASAVIVGVVGVVIWISLCHLELELRLLAPFGLDEWLGLGQRSAFNPLEHLDTSLWQAYTFLAIRFFGLAVVVPIIEEFFLRGFLMRFVTDAAEPWWKLPIGQVDRTAIIVGTFVPMLMHPGELLAAFVWFSLVTWLMIKTRSIWNCVIAHAVTNLLLGIYVVAWDQWQLM